MSRFWEEFRKARDNARLNQRDLARVLGVDKAVVSRWETGKRVMSHAHFVAACDHLGWVGKHKDAMERLKLEEEEPS